MTQGLRLAFFVHQEEVPASSEDMMVDPDTAGFVLRDKPPIAQTISSAFSLALDGIFRHAATKSCSDFFFFDVRFAGPRHRGCFAGHTMILTPDGEKRIDEISAGDVVLSFNQASASLVERKVTRIIVRDGVGHFIVRHKGPGTPLAVTGDHVVLTETGWKRVKEIHAYADSLIAAQNEQQCSVLVTDVSRGKASVRMYNLRTQTEHNFVANGIVAHNFSTLRGLRTQMHQIAEKTRDLLNFG